METDKHNGLIDNNASVFIINRIAKNEKWLNLFPIKIQTDFINFLKHQNYIWHTSTAPDAFSRTRYPRYGDDKISVYESVQVNPEPVMDPRLFKFKAFEVIFRISYYVDMYVRFLDKEREERSTLHSRHTLGHVNDKEYDREIYRISSRYEQDLRIPSKHIINILNDQDINVLRAITPGSFSSRLQKGRFYSWLATHPFELDKLGSEKKYVLDRLAKII